MRKLGWVVGLIGLLLFSMSCDNPTESRSNPYEQHPIDWPSLADSPWPMAYGNPQHTCQSQVEARFKGKIKWALAIGGGILSGIAIDNNNYVYTGSQYFPNFYKINGEGNIVWQLESRSVNGSPLIDKKGNIYFGSYWRSKGLYAVTQAGNIKWYFRADAGIETKGINITKEGNLVFTSGGKLYCVDSTSNLKWIFEQQELYDWPGCSITPDGNTILAAGVQSGICAVSKSGQLLWAKMEGRMLKDAPAIDNNGNCYFLSISSTPQTDSSIVLSAMTQLGELLWERMVTTNLWTEELTSVAISKDGLLLFATILYVDSNSYASALYCYNLNGDKLWATSIESDDFNAPLLLTADDLIFLASTNRTGGKVYAFSKNGSLIWSSPIEGAVDCSMAQLADGSILFGTHGSTSYLYLLR